MPIDTPVAIMISLLHRIYRAIPKPPSTNLATGQFTCDVCSMLPPGARVLDVGAKDARGRKSASKHIQYIATDIVGAPGLDVVADGHQLPFQTASIDAVFCVNVLMYCRNPFAVIAEIRRILKPGGSIYVSTAFVYRIAPDPDDYYRFSASGLLQLCHGFEPVQNGYNRGPGSIMADLLVHFLALLCSFNNRALRSILVDLFQWCFFWIKYVDYVLNHYSGADVIHSAAFFFGRAPVPTSTPSREIREAEATRTTGHDIREVPCSR